MTTDSHNQIYCKWYQLWGSESSLNTRNTLFEVWIAEKKQPKDKEFNELFMTISECQNEVLHII